jgi:hypothetical protein
LASLCGEGSGLFDVELGDDLRLAFVENLKVFFMKIAYGVSLRVPHYGAHHHQLYIHLECGGFVVRSELGRVLSDFRLRRRARSRSLLRTVLCKGAGWVSEKPGDAHEKTGKQGVNEEEA